MTTTTTNTTGPAYIKRATSRISREVNFHDLPVEVVDDEPVGFIIACDHEVTGELLMVAACPTCWDGNVGNCDIGCGHDDDPSSWRRVRVRCSHEEWDTEVIPCREAGCDFHGEGGHKDCGTQDVCRDCGAVF